MAEIMQFKAESKRLLNLMVNSIYTNKEIFLRELISNASDAIDRYHYLSLTTDEFPKKSDYEIKLRIDKEKRLFVISDNGIGMTKEELINSLGTIAKSGSLEFLEKIKDQKEVPIDIIGKFGVGFYSAFMVASLIEVKTRSLKEEKGYLFKSTGEDTFSIEDAEKEESGTEITLHLRENDTDYDYNQFLDQWKIQSLVKKYSDYVRYPITMDITKSVLKEGTKDEYEDKTTNETLNSMIPIWKKKKGEIEDKEYNDFYKEKYYDYTDPQLRILLNVEGKVAYTSLLFVPGEVPYNLYSEKYEKGLQLYAKGVFIMDKCKELIPDYLRFVKGLVDSSDLDLNISREFLQKSKVLKDIADNIEKKIISRLDNLMKDSKEEYLKFFKNYGLNLKFGIYQDYGMKKDLLKDLLIYNSVKTSEMISFKEYVAEMKEGQEYIYYVSAKNKEQVLAMPQMDLIKKQDYDVLILPDDVDEFVMNILMEYDGHKFKSVNQGDLDLLDKEKKEALDKLNTEKKPILDALKDALKDKVKDVIISKRLTESAVCLVSSEGFSFEMEKVIAKMPNSGNIKAEKILEINPHHELFKALEKIYLNTPQDIGKYAELLYDQALLMEGFPIENPALFSQRMCDLIIKSVK